MSTNSKHFSFVLLPRFNMMTMTTVMEPMRIANYLSSTEPFTWDFRSSEPGMVKASNGMEVFCKGLQEDDACRPDYIGVFASWGAEKYRNQELSNWLRRQSQKGKLLIGVELGVYALARARVLAGRTVTTHWSWKPGFAEEFPNVDVCEQLFTVNANIASCSGGTAGLDMMLQLIADDSGEQLAIEIANQIMHYPRRSAESPQRHAAGAISKDIHASVREAVKLLEANVEEPYTIPQICKKLKVSQRSLERLFMRDTGCTIVQFSKLLRLQYARVLLTSTKMSVREVSVACGFNSLSYFSQCFGTMFSKRPSEYRQAWPDDEAAPSWPGTVYSFIRESKRGT
ncbi:hypothetical protein AB833_31070 [Chromatiales bacterium (ex Bugula neritina AB1)]|nr:hypothetical protein AB833_31070 [Chromatiales bacterium (ex Bugula neritina AB1)]